MNIDLKNVSVDYASTEGVAKDGAVHALQDISLSIASGESVAVIGPSGCGKSTLLKVMCGLVSPNTGEVVFGGSDDAHHAVSSQIDTNVCSFDAVRDDSKTQQPITTRGTLKAQRPSTAFIQQNYGLLPWFNVKKNVELGLAIQRVGKRRQSQSVFKSKRVCCLSKHERTQRAKTALETVGLQDFARVYPNQLSGGMQQRVAIARALAMDAQLLLMDEPLSALDPALREGLQDTLLQLWVTHGYTQVIVTHSIEEAVYLGQKIVVIAQQPGRISAVIVNSDASHFAKLQDGVNMSGAVVQFRNSEEFFDRCRQVHIAFEKSVEPNLK